MTSPVNITFQKTAMSMEVMKELLRIIGNNNLSTFKDAVNDWVQTHYDEFKFSDDPIYQTAFAIELYAIGLINNDPEYWEHFNKFKSTKTADISSYIYPVNVGDVWTFDNVPVTVIDILSGKDAFKKYNSTVIGRNDSLDNWGRNRQRRIEGDDIAVVYRTPYGIYAERLDVFLNRRTFVKHASQKIADIVEHVSPSMDDEGNWDFVKPLYYDDLPESVQDRAIDNYYYDIIPDIHDLIDNFKMDAERRGLELDVIRAGTNPIDLEMQISVIDWGKFVRDFKQSDTKLDVSPEVWIALLQGLINIKFKIYDVIVEDYGAEEAYPEINWDDVLPMIEDAAATYFDKLGDIYREQLDKSQNPTRKDIENYLRDSGFRFDSNGRIAANQSGNSKFSDVLTLIGDTDWNSLPENLRPYQVWRSKTEQPFDVGNFLFVIDPTIIDTDIIKYYNGFPYKGFKIAKGFWVSNLRNTSYIKEWVDYGGLPVIVWTSNSYGASTKKFELVLSDFRELLKNETLSSLKFSDIVRKLMFGNIDVSKIPYFDEVDDIRETLVKDVPIELISISPKQFRDVVNDINEGSVSRTPDEPITLIYDTGHQSFLVSDGMHRLIQKYLDGHKTIDAYIVKYDYPPVVNPYERYRLAELFNNNKLLTFSAISEDSIVSDQDINTNPTQEQIESGNYKKGHVAGQSDPWRTWFMYPLFMQEKYGLKVGDEVRFLPRGAEIIARQMTISPLILMLRDWVVYKFERKSNDDIVYLHSIGLSNGEPEYENYHTTIPAYNWHVFVEKIDNTKEAKLGVGQYNNLEESNSSILAESSKLTFSDITDQIRYEVVPAKEYSDLSFLPWVSRSNIGLGYPSDEEGIVAKYKGKIIGIMSFELLDVKYKGLPVIGYTAVLVNPRYANKGIGKKLQEAFISYLNGEYGVDNYYIVSGALTPKGQKMLDYRRSLMFDPKKLIVDEPGLDPNMILEHHVIEKGEDPNQVITSLKFSDISSLFKFSDVRDIKPHPSVEEAFKGSVVRYEDGSLKPLFHGTPFIFKEFNPKKTNEIGFHFGPVEQANIILKKREQWADEPAVIKYRKNVPVYYDDDYNKKIEYAANIRPVFLNIKNPLYLQDVGYWDTSNIMEELVTRRILKYIPGDEDNKYVVDRYGNTFYYPKDNTELKLLLKKLGYDGIAYKNRYERGTKGKIDWTYIPFSINQIQPAFSPLKGKSNIDKILSTNEDSLTFSSIKFSDIITNLNPEPKKGEIWCLIDDENECRRILDTGTYKQIRKEFGIQNPYVSLKEYGVAYEDTEYGVQFFAPLESFLKNYRRVFDSDMEIEASLKTSVKKKIIDWSKLRLVFKEDKDHYEEYIQAIYDGKVIGTLFFEIFRRKVHILSTRVDIEYSNQGLGKFMQEALVSYLNGKFGIGNYSVSTEVVSPEGYAMARERSRLMFNPEKNKIHWLDIEEAVDVDENYDINLVAKYLKEHGIPFDDTGGYITVPTNYIDEANALVKKLLRKKSDASRLLFTDITKVSSLKFSDKHAFPYKIGDTFIFKENSVLFNQIEQFANNKMLPKYVLTIYDAGYSTLHDYIRDCELTLLSINWYDEIALLTVHNPIDLTIRLFDIDVSFDVIETDLIPVSSKMSAMPQPVRDSLDYPRFNIIS